MDLEEFRRECGKIASGGRGLIGDCYAPAAEWPQIRKRMHAMLTEAQGFQSYFANTGRHMQAQGYALKLSQWPFVAQIPHEKRPSAEHPKATGMPHVVMSRPRNPAECALVYALMEANMLVLQMCKPTGNAWVLPGNVEPEALYERAVAEGATHATLTRTAAHCVQVKSADDLRRLFKAPTAWPRLQR